MFKVEIDYDTALADINAYIDKKRLLPKRRESLQAPIEAIAEAISLGFIVIGDNDIITHTLIDPIKDSAGNIAYDKIIYKSRLDPSIVNKKISELKVLTQATQTAVISSLLTDQPIAVLNKMEPQDRNICDCISLFFV